MTFSKRLLGEFIGSAFLLAIVVGSGIMAERLAAGNIAIALLANAIATGTGLLAIIFMFSNLSGAHFNPVVTLSALLQKNVEGKEFLAYSLAQIGGALVGVMVAHIMFELPLIAASLHQRSGYAQLFSEFVASFGLIAVIISCNRTKPSITPFAVACYIVSAYWFTASTSFANPAVTLARALTNTFAGIRPADVAAFIGAQVAGAFTASFLFSWLFSQSAASSDAVNTIPESRTSA